MSKKIIAIVSAVIIVIAAVCAVLFLIPKDESPDEQVSENIIIPTSEDVQKYSPQLSIEEIDAITSEELSEEEMEKIGEFIKETEIVEVFEYVDDGNPEDNIETYLGVDGNIHQLEIDPALKEVSDEEATQSAADIIEYHKKIAAGEINPLEGQEEVVTGDYETDPDVNADANTTPDGTDYNAPLDQGDWSGDTLPDWVKDDPGYTSGEDMGYEDNGIEGGSQGEGTGQGFWIN